jgi:hypothetical protein
MHEFFAFLACFEFIVPNSAYHGNVLKPKQVLCLESIYLFIQFRLHGKITRLITLFKLRQVLNLNVPIFMFLGPLHQNNCAGLSNNTVVTNS